MSRKESISEHTMNWSKAHIPGLKAWAEDKIDQFTHGPEDTPQSSSQAQARAPD